MQFGSDVDPWPSDSVCGEPTYVRYDPAHPEHCEIDPDRIVEEYGEREHGHRMLIPQWSVDGKREIRPPSAGVAASAPTQAPAPQGNNVVEDLGELAALHATGALSDAEFAAAKARLIGPT